MTRIEVPPNIIEQLMKFCIENKLGMSAAGGNGFAIIIMGDREEPVDRIALVCAQTLIEGVVTNNWNQSNETRILSEEPDSIQ